MEELKPPKNENGDKSSPDLENLDNGENNTHHDFITFSDDFDSACSTPYVSAPSSPGRGSSGGGFFYSAPASPMHYILSTSSNHSSTPNHSTTSVSSSFEFEFSGRYASNDSASSGSMSSADELFLNGKIRPMKLSSHLQRPQMLAPLIDLDEGEEGVDGDDDKVMRGRDLKLRDRSKSLRRRTRSMSPLRTSAFQWLECLDDEKEAGEINVAKDGLEPKQSDAAEAENETPASGASSRSSSVGRNSKRWVFLKEFLYRSKSEGRNSTSNAHKFWSSISFAPTKDKKSPTDSTKTTPAPPRTTAETTTSKAKEGVKEAAPAAKKAVNGIGGKRRVTRSAHEIHYATNRAQSEEMRRKTYLPYRQGLLGCLGFSSKSYGAMNGFARALNPVSSR